TGFITAFFCTMTGFALIWHIWWMVGLGLVAAYAVFVWFAWRDAVEYSIPAEEVARYDRDRRRAREQWLAQHAGQPACAGPTPHPSVPAIRTGSGAAVIGSAPALVGDTCMQPGTAKGARPPSA